MADKTPATLLDRVILRLSPASGLQRLLARQRAHVLMNYDGASRGRRTYAWRAPEGSADSAAYGVRGQLRNLSRDFVRNRPYAARGVAVITNNVVAKGISPSISAESEDVEKQAREVFAEHFGTKAIDALGEMTLSAIQRVVMNAVVEDGEVLVRRRYRSGKYRKGLRLSFQIEVLEADYLDTSVQSYGGNDVIEGVEIGPTGMIVAYHLYKQHPGAVRNNYDYSSVRVPAADILHVRRMDRPGQLRGVSWFAPIMMTLGDLSDYQEAEIVKQKMAALMAAFIENAEDPDPVASGGVGSDKSDAGFAQMMAPGAVLELGQGQKVSFSTPPTVQGFDGFMRHGLTSVAMGLGITYESLSGDLSRVNFSSARMGRMEMDKNIEAWQQDIIINQLCRGVELWAREAWQMETGLLSPDFSVTWTAPRRALVDPTKEIPALVKKIEAGLTSRHRVIRELGEDPDEIDREIAAENVGALPKGGKKDAE